MAVAKTNFTSTISNTKLVEICHTWTIHNISFLLKDTEEIRSSPFRTSSDNSWRWQCIMRQENRLIKFGLVIDYGSPYNFPRRPAEFTFTILNTEKQPASYERNYRIFEKKTLKHYASTNPKDTELFKYAEGPEDTLTIVCRVRELLSITNGNFTIPPCKLKNDLKTIFNDPQFPDVTLIVEDRIIKAHRAILSARSPVFAAMFTSEMLESHQHQVTIPDMKYTVAQSMLEFIYTGETIIEPGTADCLLVAADKYDLMRLKAQCEEAISSTISVATAIKTLIFADRTNAEHLKSRTMAIIKANMDKVIESDDWTAMIVEHPSLLVEVCRTLAIK